MSDLPNDVNSRNNQRVSVTPTNAVPNSPISHSSARSLSGPMRVTVGGEESHEVIPNHIETQVRNGRGFMRATASEGGEVTIEHGAEVSKATAAPVTAQSAILSTAISKDGRKLAPHQITSDALVKLPNGMQARVADAVNVGLLQQTPDGRIVDPSAPAAYSQTPPMNPFEAIQPKQQQAPQQAQQSAEPAPEALDQQTEERLTQLVENSDPSAQVALINYLVKNDGAINDAAVERVASQVGQSPDDVRNFIGTYQEAMTAQAATAIEGMGMQFEAFSDLAQQHFGQELQAAVREHITTRSTKAYASLVNTVRENLDKLDPVNTAMALQSAGIRHHQSSNGRFVVMVPGRGQMPYSVAVKNGLLKVSKN